MEKEANWKEVCKTDFRSIEEFKRNGYTYRRIASEYEWMVWKLSKDNDNESRFELWKRKNAKNPDGSLIWASPSDEEFGKYAWYIHLKDDDACWNRIFEIIKEVSSRSR